MNNGTWITSGYKPGDLPIFDFGKGIAHIGIIKALRPDGSFDTYEGNTSSNGSQDNGGAVLQKVRYKKNIVGCCRPAYASQDQIQKILDLAATQLKITESPPDSNNVKYNTEYYGREVFDTPKMKYPWCVVFIWWLFKTTGLASLFYGGSKTASCTALSAFYGYVKPAAAKPTVKPVTIPSATIRLYDIGSDVKLLQTKLNSLGFPCGAVDGEFGKLTIAAVKAFQKAHSLVVDGIVGKITWTVLLNP